MHTTQTTTTFEIRRTLDVRPEDYHTQAGTDFGTAATLAEALEVAIRQGATGYPSRVIEVTADGARRCVSAYPQRRQTCCNCLVTVGTLRDGTTPHPYTTERHEADSRGPARVWHRCIDTAGCEARRAKVSAPA